MNFKRNGYWYKNMPGLCMSLVDAIRTNRGALSPITSTATPVSAAAAKQQH
jgi:hypothetical protein